MSHGRQMAGRDVRVAADDEAVITVLDEAVRVVLVRMIVRGGVPGVTALAVWDVLGTNGARIVLSMARRSVLAAVAGGRRPIPVTVVGVQTNVRGVVQTKGVVRTTVGVQTTGGGTTERVPARSAVDGRSGRAVGLSGKRTRWYGPDTRREPMNRQPQQILTSRCCRSR